MCVCVCGEQGEYFGGIDYFKVSFFFIRKFVNENLVFDHLRPPFKLFVSGFCCFVYFLCYLSDYFY